MRFSVARATVEDLPALESVHRAAFPTDVESQLVRLLLTRGQATVSLGAVLDGQTIGHVLFSPATCETSPKERRAPGVSRPVTPTNGVGLAPLAVVPAYQRQGVGSALVQAGIAACQQLGIGWIVVLGEGAYYARFGFVPASHYSLSGEFGGDDAFQMLVLEGLEPPASGGLIRYAPEFRELLGN